MGDLEIESHREQKIREESLSKNWVGWLGERLVEDKAVEDGGGKKGRWPHNFDGN